jgi:hypothetical protein
MKTNKYLTFWVVLLVINFPMVIIGIWNLFTVLISFMCKKANGEPFEGLSSYLSIFPTAVVAYLIFNLLIILLKKTPHYKTQGTCTEKVSHLG